LTIPLNVVLFLHNVRRALMINVNVRVAFDDAFRSLYWTSPLKTKNNILSALKTFSDTFPAVHFNVLPPERWDSQNIPYLCSFPSSLTTWIKKGASPEEITRHLVGEAQKLGFDREFCDEEKLEQNLKRIERKSKDYKLGYLRGWLVSSLEGELMSSLKRNVPCLQGEIVFGFTGKILVEDGSTFRGLAQIGGKYAAFPMQRGGEERLIILHEMGHLFGADHPAGNEESVMQLRLSGSDKFDRENMKIIRKRIKKWN
jgi:hypothetical protein